MEQVGPMQLKKSEYRQEKLLKFVRPSENSVFRCHNPKAVKL